MLLKLEPDAHVALQLLGFIVILGIEFVSCCRETI